LQYNASTAPTHPTHPTPYSPSLPKNESMANISPKSGSVSTIIRSYKSACTKQINLLRPALNFKWQERFHDHIIRTEDDFIRIENYIINNPKNWLQDKFHL
jgi:putative transposase